MSVPSTRIGLVAKIESASPEIGYCFHHLPRLVKEFPLEIALAYAFSVVERAQNAAIYCGIVKLHKTDSKLTGKIVQKQHLTRELFETMYTAIFGEGTPRQTAKKLEAAQRSRDLVMHGKQVNDASMRSALANVIDYAEELNDEVDRLAGFRPFGDLRGFKGRAQSLPASTTRWILRGLGFHVS